MEFLSKKRSLYARDEVGKLIPQKTELINYFTDDEKEIKGVYIHATPLPRGALKKYLSVVPKDEDDKDFDGEIILNNAFDDKGDPLYTKEEIPFIKPKESKSITETILYISGFPIKLLNSSKSKREAVKKKEDDFAKN